MAKAVGGGIGGANKYDLTEGTLGYDPSVPFYSFDLAKAQALIKESGVTTPLNVRLTVITREADLQQAQILQQMLDKIGVKIDIEGLERGAWGQKVRQSNDFEMATQQTSTPLDRTRSRRAWAPDGPAAYVRPSEPQIQDCLAEGRDLRRPEAPGDLFEVRDPDVRDGLVGSHVDPAVQLPDEEESEDLEPVLLRGLARVEHVVLLISQ